MGLKLGLSGHPKPCQIRDIFRSIDANRDRYRKIMNQTMTHLKSLGGKGWVDRWLDG